MKEIVVKKNDFNALEVLRNHDLLPRMGMNPLSYRDMVIKERQIITQISAALQRGRNPKLLNLLIDFNAFTEEDKVRLQDLFTVLHKVFDLLVQGFHVQIIGAMMRATAGYESHFEWQFDEKFARALYSKERREEFWGTKYLLPIVLVECILVDLMDGININQPTEADLRKSETVKYALTIYKKEDCEHKLENFIRLYS